MKVHEEELEQSALDFVTEFAKQTGDYKTLSAVDMRVIALGVQLARARGEQLEKEPKPLTEFKPKKYQEEYKKKEEEDEDDDSEDEEEEE